MTFFAFVIAIAAFLSGGAAAIFAMLVIGIHKGDRPRHLSEAPDTPLDAVTRSVLGIGFRTGWPAGRSDREEN
jgi:hypothetical protein